MKNLLKIITLLSLVFFLTDSAWAGRRDPVAVISQVKGKVEYMKSNKKKWKKVRSNKFLFPGYQVKTDAKGGGLITIQKTGKNYAVGANSVVEITDKGVKAVSGSLKESKAGSALVGSLMKRFDKSQKYTTVRRSHKKKEVKIDGVRDVTVSDQFPYIVWESPGKEYSYKLKVGGTSYDVSASGDKIVRAKLTPFSGTQTYSIVVIKDGKEVVAMKPYKKRGTLTERTVTWQAGSQANEFNQTVQTIKDNYPGNSFMLGSYFEEADLWVAAMDAYKQYLDENPDEIEMSPYLFRVYKKLKLKNVYAKELEAYKAATLD